LPACRILPCGTTAERWRRIEAVYAAALSRPAGNRARFVESACAGDDELLREVTSLLESRVSELSRLPGFTRVIAAASTRRLAESRATPAEIARTLGVCHLVTGSVSRIGERVQVAAQLIDGSDERQVWGDTFEGTTREYVAIQRDTAAAIAQAIRLRLRPEDRQRLAERTTIDPATYELYLRGMLAMRRVQDGGNAAEGLRYLQQRSIATPAIPMPTPVSRRATSRSGTAPRRRRTPGCGPARPPSAP
jgi:TolB-like protein